ncbi:MAG: hypothetical protein J0I43_02895 [Microbacterium sp.]|uniref:hypothetical protein n=1 Tax=Microbacterium sp. TaxID=51671 RepID=UPI001ACE2364|nr:hypothetical protein [Microbacterium sp.]MBN9176301.1 hypothetical protein [Microbacterium sp.]
MALIESTRIRLRPTPAERVALTVATWISTGVANRMDRRARILTEAHVRRAAHDADTARREVERARAHLLGIR